MNKDKLKELDNIGKPYKIYAEVLEDSALAQFVKVMSDESIVKGALMPDAHTGYSLPIGGVVASKGKVFPSYVGYDIGCGMCALKLDITKDALVRHEQEIFDSIYEEIPVGYNKNKRCTPTTITLDGLTDVGKGIAERKAWGRALGTLGGGNHFIEVGYDEEDYVWVVIHSGSRGVGHGIAKYYMTTASNNPAEIAEEFNKSHQDLLKYNPDQYEKYLNKYVDKKISKAQAKEGNYGFDVDSRLGKNYIQDLAWCLEYALENRKEMMNRVVKIICSVLSIDGYVATNDDLINRNHNHAELKDGLWIHRKGATHAEEGMLGVIPGNMRDGSFIVRGKGNLDSMSSSSHGAGRVMGRKEAKRRLVVSEFEDMMGGVQAKVGEDTLDECPSAYKNIFEVMNLQEDLVDVLHYVKPIINIKG